MHTCILTNQTNIVCKHACTYVRMYVSQVIHRGMPTSANQCPPVLTSASLCFRTKSSGDLAHAGSSTSLTVLPFNVLPRSNSVKQSHITYAVMGISPHVHDHGLEHLQYNTMYVCTCVHGLTHRRTKSGHHVTYIQPGLPYSLYYIYILHTYFVVQFKHSSIHCGSSYSVYCVYCL